MKVKELIDELQKEDPESDTIIIAQRDYLIEQIYKIYTSKLFKALPNEIKQIVLDALLKVAEKD